MKKIQSTCNLCALACNIDFYVENGKIAKVSPTVDYPVNKGFCCIKGLNLDKQQTKIKARKSPLLRDENGEMKEISWEEGFKTFAKKMTSIQEKYGKESFAFLSTGQLATEEMALAGHIGRTFLGGNGDGNTRLCMATSVVAYKQSFGFDAPPYTFNDLEHSDVIIFIGCNPVVAHPILWGKTKNNKDCIKIAIDPRRTETVTNCDMWIDIKPKSDLTLLYTLANVLIEKGWIDNEYINKYTEDFEDFREHVKKYTLEDIEEKTGISKGRVLELAKIIHNGKRVSLWWTMGINQGYQAVRTAQAIINIALMTGNIGRLGTGANSITGQCNAMGSRLFSNTTGLYGGGEYDNEARRKKEEEPSHFITALIENENMYRNDVNKICFLEHESIPFDEIRKQFSDAFQVIECTVPAFGDASGELSVAGVNKHTAIEALINHLGIDQKDTYAYGDGMNDAEMLTFVAHGVAVGNAKEGLKAIADEVCDDIANDGIYKNMKEHGLI